MTLNHDRHILNRNNTPITLDQIAQYAPSAMATSAHDSRSSRYTYLPTIDVIKGMQKAGFMPFSATQSRTRDESRRDFTKHMIRFRHADNLSVSWNVGQQFPEVILINSHDGTSAYKLMAGLFRLVCSNGMVVSDGMVESVSVYHKGNIIDAVIDGSTRIIENAPKMLDTVEKWSNLQLTAGERTIFAESAHTLRFADSEGQVNTPIQPAQLLNVRREEDAKPDLWHTFNRVQENVIRGGLSARTRTEDGRTRRMSTRQVNGIDQDVKLNRALWMLAEKMAALKTA